jgi:hypothetical protein
MEINMITSFVSFPFFLPLSFERVLRRNRIALDSCIAGMFAFLDCDCTHIHILSKRQYPCYSPITRAPACLCAVAEATPRQNGRMKNKNAQVGDMASA